MSLWHVIGIIFLIIILLALIGGLVAVLIGTQVVTYGACKTSTNCLTSQTCETKIINGKSVRTCLSLPGFKCRTSDDCSAYAPNCHPSDKYCTNFSSHPRGTPGNPSRDKTCPGSNTNIPLILNSSIDICQHSSLGEKCTIDAECNQGLCIDSQCNYGSQCTLDTVLNPQQCAPGLECDPTTLNCSINGVPSGGDGTPCKSSADCIGGVCVSGSGIPGFSGICRTGTQSWLVNFTDSSKTGATCIYPLVHDGTSWCRYDITNLMQCSTENDCQYPYEVCTSGECVAGTGPPVIDPTKFNYPHLAYNLSGPLDGDFWKAAFPSSPPNPLNITGAKLIIPYDQFLPHGQSFSNTISFSKYTSFSVSSLGFIFDNTETSLIDDNVNTVICTSYITNTVTETNKLFPFLGIFRSGYMINPYGQSALPCGGGYNNATTQLWTPALANSLQTNIVVSMIPNPIIKTTTVYYKNEYSYNFASILFVSDRNYIIGCNLFSVNDPTTQYYYYYGDILLYQDLTTGLTPLNMNNFVITSWDFILLETSASVFIINFIFYGIDKINGGFICSSASVQMLPKNESFGINALIVLNSNTNDNKILISQVTLPNETMTQTTQVRFSYLQPFKNPLLFSIFWISDGGKLRIDSFVFDNNSFPTTFDGVQKCYANKVFDNVNELRYVTPVSSGGVLGTFIVWFSSPICHDAFAVIQLNGICTIGPISSLSFAPMWSAVYYCMSQQEYTAGAHYFMYPLGGGALPYFLTTKDKIDFAGNPGLDPVNI